MANRQLIETPAELALCTDKTPCFSFENEVHLAKVTKCYDGDTFHCVFKHDGRYLRFNIRMLKYDSPEMRPSNKLPEDKKKLEKEKAIKAKQRLEELILEKSIYLFCHKFDKYGRILAEVKLKMTDKESINDLMIKEGYGYVYNGGTKKVPV